jgi:hypothetical protein
MAYDYDEELAERLRAAILKAVWDASKAPGKDEAHIQPPETIDALMAVLAQTLALFPPSGNLDDLVDDLAAMLKVRVPLGAKELAEDRRLNLM